MARRITVITPENIPLTLEPAGLATRFGALMIDLFVQTAVALILFCLLLILSAAGISMDFLSGEAGKGSPLGYLVIGVLIAFAFSFFSGYFIFFENIWNGQTPGKRMFHLRVIRSGGYPVDFASVATRNLVRLADFLPVSYAVGAVTMFFNPNYQRLGDLVAGTVVIKEQAGTNLPTFGKKRTVTGALADATLPAGTYEPLTVLTADEIDLLRQFATRRWQMSSDDSERLAYRLVAPLVPRLNIVFLPGADPHYADLASAIVAVADKREAELMQQR